MRQGAHRGTGLHRHNGNESLSAEWAQDQQGGEILIKKGQDKLIHKFLILLLIRWERKKNKKYGKDCVNENNFSYDLPMNTEVNWHLCTEPCRHPPAVLSGEGALRVGVSLGLGLPQLVWNRAASSQIAAAKLGTWPYSSKLCFFDSHLKEFLYLLWLQLVQETIQKCLVKYSRSVL